MSLGRRRFDLCLVLIWPIMAVLISFVVGAGLVASMLIALGVLATQGILLQPAVAALFMSVSTVIVAFNAILLKRRKL